MLWTVRQAVHVRRVLKKNWNPLRRGGFIKSGLGTHTLAMAAALLLGGLSLAAAQPVPIPAAPPIHAAAEYTRPLRSVPGGNLSAVAIPGATPYKLVHLHGSTEERGFAYGRLLHADIMELCGQMDYFYRSEVTSIPWAKLVHPLLPPPPPHPRPPPG